MANRHSEPLGQRHTLESGIQVRASLAVEDWNSDLRQGSAVSLGHIKYRGAAKEGDLPFGVLTSLLVPLLLLVVGGSDDADSLLASLDLSVQRLPGSITRYFGGLRKL